MGPAEEWAALCDRFDVAHKELTEAWGVVMLRFGSVSAGYQVNPTEDEMARLERAQAAWDALDAEMREFMRRHSA
jgi:hypothetical protein